MWVVRERRCKLEIWCPWNAKLSFALYLEATPVGGVLDNVLRAVQSGRVPAGHPATKPKLLEEWTWLVQLLYDCLFLVLQSLQCRGGKHGILLVQLQKQLDEVCYNHTPGMHTSIITSQIILAYNNFTHIGCKLQLAMAWIIRYSGTLWVWLLAITQNHAHNLPLTCCLDGPLLLFQIEDSLTDQCKWISVKHASYAKVTCFHACTARTEGRQVMRRSNVSFKTVPDIYMCALLSQMH